MLQILTIYIAMSCLNAKMGLCTPHFLQCDTTTVWAGNRWSQYYTIFAMFKGCVKFKHSQKDFNFCNIQFNKVLPNFK